MRLKKGEQYSNRVRKNPGANMLAANDSLTDKCNDCDFKIRILTVAGRITAAINGTVVNHVTDPAPHGGGYIGLRSMQGVARYRRPMTPFLKRPPHPSPITVKK